ncbi:unnamed protein product [Brugia timori]|uniref:Photolyase/cryptochrome alpha/beta domain-containing protein n=1 Tax=Brugia timori TaxID=42155 RepID=A0A0R3QIJ5_9BILA|nr:unnamed protein product [Brugia timori]
MLFTVHRQRYEQTCKSNLSDSFNSFSNHQMKQRIYEVKRQQYVPILLFLSDESLNKNISYPSEMINPIENAKRMKHRYRRIF